MCLQAQQFILLFVLFQCCRSIYLPLCMSSNILLKLEFNIVSTLLVRVIFTQSTIHKFSIFHLMNSSKIHSKKKRGSFYLLKPFYISFLAITDPYIRVLFSKRNCRNNKATPLMYSRTWVHFTKGL